MARSNNTLPERVGILESNFQVIVKSVTNLETKADDLLKAIEAKTSPNKNLWVQFAGLLVAVVVAGAGLNFLIINAVNGKTEAALVAAVSIQNLREEWRKERETLILDNTKDSSTAIHNDILGQIKGIRAHINKMQDDMTTHEKLPMHPVTEAKIKDLEHQVQALQSKPQENP